MPLLPTTSRSQLQWHRFTRQEDESWCLVLPPFYAKLFELHFPALVTWPYKGFRDSHSGQTRIARFQKLLDKNLTDGNAFIEHYSRVVILGKNDYIKVDFEDELDFCLALDYNKPKPGPDRTEIGELEYRAKYQQDKGAIGQLVDGLVQAAKRVPKELMPKPWLFTYVPSDPSKGFCLPATLAQAVVRKIGSSFPVVSILSSRLRSKGPRNLRRMSPFRRSLLCGRVSSRLRESNCPAQ